MKPFDDRIAEENTPPYQDLTTLLRRAPSGVSVAAEEQSEMLARVRARLRQTDDVSSEGASSTSENSEGVLQSPLLRRKTPRRRLSRMRYTLNMIAAVLMVAVITAASLWLFSSQRTNGLVKSIPTGAPVGSIKAPVTVRSEAGGLEASLQVTAGPYFLSELLGVTVTFTNHSQKSILLGGTPSLNSCESAFNVTMTGGGEPRYNFTNDFLMSCPPPMSTTLTAGKVLIMYGYVPLVSSGQVTITAGAMVSINKEDKNSAGGIRWISSALNGHWPIMHIDVAARIPADRILSLQQQGSQIIIDAPASARTHLVSYDTVSCTGGGIINIATSAGWSPVTTPTISERGCSGANKHWTCAVGAPGYAIASIEISS